MLLASINPLGPTRKAQKLSVLLIDIVLTSAQAHTRKTHGVVPSRRDVRTRVCDVASLTSGG